jgi:hypothetical protein
MYVNVCLLLTSVFDFVKCILVHLYDNLVIIVTILIVHILGHSWDTFMIMITFLIVHSFALRHHSEWIMGYGWMAKSFNSLRNLI